MNKILIVDGHNAVFRSTSLKEKGASAIDALVGMLNSCAFLEYDEIIVVFDANEPIRKTYSEGRVTMVLAAKTESADTVISQLVEKLRESSRVVVVSDDYSVQLSAIHRSQLRMTTKEFFQRYELYRARSVGEGEKRGTLLEKLSKEEREGLENLYRFLVEKERKIKS
jgi:predicted RNA-binding protein with PIN domain